VVLSEKNQNFLSLLVFFAFFEKRRQRHKFKATVATVIPAWKLTFLRSIKTFDGIIKKKKKSAIFFLTRGSFLFIMVFDSCGDFYLHTHLVVRGLQAGGYVLILIWFDFLVFSAVGNRKGGLGSGDFLGAWKEVVAAKKNFEAISYVFAPN